MLVESPETVNFDPKAEETSVDQLEQKPSRAN